MGPIMIVQAVISVAASIAFSPVLGAALSSLMNQVDTGRFSLANLGKAVAVAYLTPGIDEGLGLNDFQSIGANLVSSDPAVTLVNLGNTARAERCECRYLDSDPGRLVPHGPEKQCRG
ncbi:hypothetical protein [Burkholderia cepacia]|uniref:hypothetical protein n=1 Tax=Burkholderia cepacia TaxID=292 RepID=UPI001FC8503A|nr:hypothetical protein [Burkholderia cepacia]